jgi:predicted nucleic acid-binding protein
MKESVYIETSIISYLCSRPSRDLVIAANQEVTREWWDQRRGMYDLYISDYVISEIAAGDESAASRRLALVDGIPLLDANDEVIRLTEDIMRSLKLPSQLEADMEHVAIASVHGMDYVLTLNMTHIANPHWQALLEKAITDGGYNMPLMCVPQALLEGESR